ncbi:hypothetical protein RHEC894_PC00090 (plasmid) [Rhizobium sp. CIAT894]|nr:hypothetical protein RHEC894_PC00090 [Rhizobium sp. CIAT894]
MKPSRGPRAGVAEIGGSGRLAARHAALKRPAAGLRPQTNPKGGQAGDVTSKETEAEILYR